MGLIPNLSTIEWAEISIVITVALFVIPYIWPPQLRAAKERGEKPTKRTIPVPIPKRYPRLSQSGHPILTQKRALLIFGEERVGYFLNRAGLFFGFGMLFMLYLLVTQLAQDYPYLQITPNPIWVGSLLGIPIGLELIGGSLVRDARHRMKSEAWIEARGEILAWSGVPPTPRVRRAVMTEEEKELLERLEEEENR